MTDENASPVEQTEVQGGDPEGDANAVNEIDLDALDVSKLPADKLLSHPEVQKALQSLKDKEASRIERSYRERAEREAAAQRRLAEERELDALIETEDYDSLGRQTAQGRARAKQLQMAAQEVNAVIDGLVRERPEFKELGEETIERVFTSVRERQGTIIDVVNELAAERTQREIAKAVEEARKSFNDDVTAILAEYGLEKRNKDVEEGNAPSVSVTKGGPKKMEQASDDELLDAYGRGESVPQDKIRAILKERGIKL